MIVGVFRLLVKVAVHDERGDLSRMGVVVQLRLVVLELVRSKCDSDYGSESPTHETGDSGPSAPILIHAAILEQAWPPVKDPAE